MDNEVKRADKFCTFTGMDIDKRVTYLEEHVVELEKTVFGLKQTIKNMKEQQFKSYWDSDWK